MFKLLYGTDLTNEISCEEPDADLEFREFISKLFHQEDIPYVLLGKLHNSTDTILDCNQSGYEAYNAS